MGGALPSKFRGSKRVSRKYMSEGRVNKRMLALLLDENEPIRLTLDDKSFIFLEGMWIPDISAKDYRKLSKQNQYLAAENGLLKLKADILLELVTSRSAEKPKKLLTQRRNSVIKNYPGYASPDVMTPSTLDLVTRDKTADFKSRPNSSDLEGVLFSIGDPLLDIVAEVPSSILQKHRLGADSGMLMGEEQSGLVDELMSGSYEISYVPGGSEQNCLKVVQRLVGVPGATSYLGCIGRDRNGALLENAMKEHGINARYQYVDDQPTGLCYICLTGMKRSLVTRLGAAQSPVIELLQRPDSWALVERARYFYVEAYSVANRFDEMLMIARHALQHNKVFAMNLSCPYLGARFKERLNKVFPFVDVLFGSEPEALAFGAARGLDTKDIGEIALSLARTPKENGRRGRLVILTRGKEPAVAICDGQIRFYPVIPTAAEDIQDTVGAGDAFAGGYLAALVTGHKHEECVRAALEAAHYVLRFRGCEILPNFNESLGLHLTPSAELSKRSSVVSYPASRKGDSS